MTTAIRPSLRPLATTRPVVATSVYVSLRRLRDAADSERPHMDTKPEHRLHQRAFKRSETRERSCHLHRRVSEGQVWSFKCQALRNIYPEKRAHVFWMRLQVSFPPFLFEVFFFRPINEEKSEAKIGNGVCSFHTAEEERWIMAAALHKHW